MRALPSSLAVLMASSSETPPSAPISLGSPMTWTNANSALSERASSMPTLAAWTAKGPLLIAIRTLQSIALPEVHGRSRSHQDAPLVVGDEEERLEGNFCPTNRLSIT